MRRTLFALALVATVPLPAMGGPPPCAAPICVQPRDELGLSRLLTFEDVPNSLGVGARIDDLLTRPGARLGERFAGQILTQDGDFDRVSGRPDAPLTVQPGTPGRNLGAIRLPGTVVLHGLGPRGFPRAEAIGEGAIAIAFDHDQGALALDLRGGEGGHATVIFYRRDGSIIHRLHLSPLGEDSFGFLRNATDADIAGLLILNSDPQGIAIDNLAFDDPKPSG